MHFYATLTLGSTYKYKEYIFERGVELPVTEEAAEYLKTVVDPRVVSEGNGFVVKDLHKFKVREEELTAKEKVELETEDTPDTLKLNKPGPKPKA